MGLPRARGVVGHRWIPCFAPCVAGSIRGIGVRTMIGRVLGHYQILARLGEGGMGVVWRAYDEKLRREVALKILPPHLLNHGRARERLQREALILAKLNHPHIESVYDFGTEGDLDYLVMELVAGPTLAERISGGPLGEAELRSIGIALADGLAAAHQFGAVHRDGKPSNIAFDEEGRLKILDFGLARV